jgi:toxin YoeB
MNWDLMMNKIGFSPMAWEDYEYWETQDKKTLKKIKILTKELQRHPFEGTGKPEC